MMKCLGKRKGAFTPVYFKMLHIYRLKTQGLGNNLHCSLLPGILWWYFWNMTRKMLFYKTWWNMSWWHEEIKTLWAWNMFNFVSQVSSTHFLKHNNFLAFILQLVNFMLLSIEHQHFFKHNFCVSFISLLHSRG